MMKTMRYILPVIAMCALTACDNYLDIEPKGRAQLETVEDCIGLLEEISPNYDQGNLWVMSGDCSWYKTEELKNYTVPLWSAAFFWDESYDRAGNTIESELYNSCYNRITNYNAMIASLPEVTGSDDARTQAMAQAKAMRAYNYFFLVNTFAPPYDPATAGSTRGIIVRERMFESLEEVGMQQSVGYTYDFIKRDLEEAVADLPHNALNTFRPDRTFGLALKAKVHLFMREFDECIAACEEALEEARVAGHELWDMNVDYNKWSPQMLAYYGTDMAVDDPSYMAVNDLIENIWKNSVIYGYDGAENLLYQFGSTYTDPFPMYVTGDMLELFERDADLRYRFCIRYKRTHETSPENDREFASMGYRWNPGGMRLSEVYLMLAECHARKGTPSDISRAMQYLDELRSHRLIYGKYNVLTAATRDEAMRHVREERRRELFLTYNGFFDMRRFMTEFGETRTKQFEGTTYTLRPGSHMLTYPFPLKAMQTSNLIQNSK